jgi:hypothetical protein
MAGLRDAGCWWLDEKQNTPESFFLFFMSIQYQVRLTPMAATE